MGTLILVATPLGNLEDISRRALATLARADVVLAEDTRHSGLLLQHLGLKKSLLSYHKYNECARAAQVLPRLRAGETVALVSDAGTPCISDPGGEMVRQAILDGHEVLAVPGPCALVMALIVSGLPAERFVFEGFLPRAAAGKKRLAELRSEERTMIFYEAPHRLLATLTNMAAAFGADRPAAVCRELSKKFEETRRSSLAELLALYKEREILGELVIVVGGAKVVPEEVTEEEIRRELARLLSGGMGHKAAAKEVAARHKLAVKSVYALALLDKKQERE